MLDFLHCNEQKFWCNLLLQSVLTRGSIALVPEMPGEHTCGRWMFYRRTIVAPFEPRGAGTRSSGSQLKHNNYVNNYMHMGTKQLYYTCSCWSSLRSEQYSSVFSLLSAIQAETVCSWASFFIIISCNICRFTSFISNCGMPSWSKILLNQLDTCQYTDWLHDRCVSVWDDTSREFASMCVSLVPRSGSLHHQLVCLGCL